MRAYRAPIYEISVAYAIGFSSTRQHHIYTHFIYIYRCPNYIVPKGNYITLYVNVIIIRYWIRLKEMSVCSSVGIHLKCMECRQNVRNWTMQNAHIWRLRFIGKKNMCVWVYARVCVCECECYEQTTRIDLIRERFNKLYRKFIELETEACNPFSILEMLAIFPFCVSMLLYTYSVCMCITQRHFLVL